MFAIIQTGGKQYRVKQGDELQVELLATVDGAKSVRLDRVLLLSDDSGTKIGTPFVKGAYVDTELLGEVKGLKKISFKYIRREKAATKIGHRQRYLKLRVKSLHKGE